MKYPVIFKIALHDSACLRDTGLDDMVAERYKSNI